MAARLFSQGLRPLRHAALSLSTARPLPAHRSAHLSVRAMSAEGGNITSELIQGMKSKIQEALQAQAVEVADVAGDGRHVEIVVVSKEFEGKSAVNRQRMVYKAIWEELQDTVHAVDAMVTQTPEEAGL